MENPSHCSLSLKLKASSLSSPPALMPSFSGTAQQTSTALPYPLMHLEKYPLGMDGFALRLDNGCEQRRARNDPVTMEGGGSEASEQPLARTGWTLVNL
eukprot:756670-Hanusia_phi.AAC.7